MDYFDSELLSPELDLPKPSKNFNIALKKFTACTSNKSNSMNHSRSISVTRSRSGTVSRTNRTS